MAEVFQKSIAFIHNEKKPLFLNEAMRFRNKKLSRGEAKRTPKDRELNREQLTI